MSQPASYAERRKQALRQEIIDAAFDIFAERGYHETGVADIAARVGIGNSTFYRQFESKQEILEQVIETTIARMLSSVTNENAPEAAQTLGEYRKQVERIAASLQETLADSRVTRLMFVQSLSAGPDIEARFFSLSELAVTLTSTYIDHGKEFGYLEPSLDSLGTARALVAMIIGAGMLSLNPDVDQTVRDRTVKSAVDLIFAGVTKS